MPEIRHSEKGYTLLELLAALGIMAMIGAMLANGLGFGLRIWERTEIEVQTGNEIYQVQSLMRDWVKSAYPYDIGRARTRIVYPMEGQDDRVTFSAPLHIDPLDDRLYRIALIHDPLSQTVTVHWLPDRNGERDPVYGNSTKSATLLENVRDLKISYLEKESAVRTRWVERWQDRKELPEAVKIDIIFGENDPRDWPPLIIKPRIMRSAHCDFDPVSRGCREGIT